MKFNWCTIQVNNMEESVKFYRDIVGLTLDRSFQAGPDTEITFLGEGETKLELIHNKNNSSVNIGADISLGFEVKSLEKMTTFLKENNISIHSGPFSPNPHIKFIYVLDPNGLKIQFAENM
ncbi:VOC family protein [Anaerocolumna sedimenticola]|uniref:VOC family protein n=1 Tax=Anaerocolumna sedimenticola TaxID=2696063 RepID=A0A6P1TE49_9FIRM|nr:VOC family protein [Anaerocolumna sedimenticola]QHQ59434.1 VOC family protein [Anaerocolumna sedimenticola]